LSAAQGFPAGSFFMEIPSTNDELLYSSDAVELSVPDFNDDLNVAVAISGKVDLFEQCEIRSQGRGKMFEALLAYLNEAQLGDSDKLSTN
jgi:hypothetical protein